MYLQSINISQSPRPGLDVIRRMIVPSSIQSHVSYLFNCMYMFSDASLNVDALC